jgi:acid phosphatase type 7
MPKNTLSRRSLLQAAGGITFLALVPHKNGFALPEPERKPVQPLFTALPYIQAGPNSSTLREGDESLVIAWQTDAKPVTFVISVMGKGEFPIARTERFSGSDGDDEDRFNYAATITGLSLAKRYTYSVTMDGKTIFEGYFTTRKPRGTKTRFVAFGDNSYGDISDRMIAYQAYKAKPDFVMNTGDNVYESGTDNEYARFFFPVYNADIAGERVGGPLLRSVPFYTVIANHDVHDKDENKHPALDFTKNPDGLAYFTNLYLPGNGMKNNPFPVPMVGNEKAKNVFLTCAGSRFPTATTYSYDYADAHFLCLDSNLYVDPTNAELQAWIAADLQATDATWKFVVYHHPAFNVGADHYAEQHMRVLSPLFERYGVDMVLNGHEHNYQRTLPLKFLPTDTQKAHNVGTKDRYIPGQFTVDRAFDGKTKTKAQGIIYVTTGAGGKHLYEPEWGETARTHAEDGNIDYIARFVSDRHSLTVFEMDNKSLVLTQVDQWGKVIDTCRITK